jgi:polysaccharide pyruvyl transferase WcaK-like protein
MAAGTNLVLWGASLGPFEDWPAAAEVFMRMLRKVSLVLARERLTLHYLRELGLSDRAATMADPAFLLPADRAKDDLPFRENSRATLAINLSPLSARHTVGEEHIAHLKRRQADMLRRILEEFDVNLVLVPHVVCPWNAGDDDYAYLADIRNVLGNTSPQRVALLQPDLGARRTKGVLSQCDALIAARMHCGIAGVSSGVPTLFLAYSPKAVGMAEYVYGHRQWVIPLEDFASPLIMEKISNLLENRVIIREQLRNTLPRLRRHAIRAGHALKQVLAG